MTLFISLLKYDKNRIAENHKNWRKQPNNESEIQKERKASADVGSRTDTHMQTWMNMAHWDLKYVWYVYYASTNTGAESGRKEGDWRKEGKTRERQGQYCLFLKKQVLLTQETECEVYCSNLSCNKYPL